MSYESESEHNVFVLALDIDAIINNDEKSPTEQPIIGSDEDWLAYLSRWKRACAEKGYTFKLAIITTDDNLTNFATTYAICTILRYLQPSTPVDMSDTGDLTTLCHYINDTEDKVQQAVINFETGDKHFSDVESAQGDSDIYYIATNSISMSDVTAKKSQGVNKLAEKYNVGEECVLFVSNTTNANPSTTIQLNFNEIDTKILNLDPCNPTAHHRLPSPSKSVAVAPAVKPSVTSAAIEPSLLECLKPTILIAINAYLAWQNNNEGFSFTHGDSGIETAEDLKNKVEHTFNQKSLCDVLYQHLNRKKKGLYRPILREHSLDTLILNAIFNNSNLMSQLGIECSWVILENSERNNFRLAVIDALHKQVKPK